MARNYQVATEFTITDRATASLNRMSAAGRGLGGAWRNGVAQAQRQLDAFGQSIKTAGKMAVGLGVGAVSAGLAVATKQYAEFDAAVRAAGASYGPAFSQAADFEDKISEIGKAVREVAASTEFDAVQSANAMKTLAQAGVKSEQAISLLPGVADLATAAMTSMDEAVGLAVGALNTMGMMSDVPEELAANMSRISDVMAHTANSAKMSLQDVGAAITAGGSFFKTTANNLDVLSGSLTALAGHSIAGAEAGTALRNIMTNLSAPTAKATKALEAMGIKTTDAAGNLLALPEIIGQFNTAMAGMGDAERNANIYEIFGKQNIAAVTALLDTGQAALENYANAAANATGTVTANAEAMRGSLSNQFKVLLSALTELGFKFVDAFAVQGGDAIKTITEAVSNFDPKPVIDALSTGVTVASSFIKTAWKLRGVIMVVTGVMVAWKVATMGAAIAMNAYNVIMGIAHGAMAAYQIGMGVATAAQTAFNVAVSANPIGLIITGVIAAVAALVALIVLIIKYWDEIVAAVKRFGVAVKEAVTTAIQNVTGFFDSIINKANSMEGFVGTITSILVVPLEMARNLLDGIVNTFTVFTSGGFVDGIKMLGLTIVETLLPPIQKFLDLLSQIPFVGDKFKDFSGELNSWIESSKAGLMPKETVSYGAEDSAGYHPYIPIPTRTAAAANSYSRQETVTTSRVQIGLDNGLKAKGGSNAPGVTINRGGSSGSF